MFGLASVRLPLQASEGAMLTDTGVSLTPVTEQGAALGGGAGIVDHAGVFYGDTEAAPVGASAGTRDLSMLAKPTTYGLEMFSMLFSERSPEHLYFKVGLPEGATLEQGRSGEVRVMKEGQAISDVTALSARDADGTAVPVSMNIASTETIELTVARKSGQYRYPLVVDPTLVDSALMTYENSAWVPASSKPANYQDGQWGAAIELFPLTAYPGGEFVAWQYETQGNSELL